MENNMEQELARKFQVFEQQIRMLQEQMNAVEQTTVELQTLDLGLDDLKDSKNKEIMAQVGRGIFVKAKVTSDDLIVDVGGKNFVSKSIENTKEVIKGQVEKLSKIREELEGELEKINEEITASFMEHQAMQEHDHKHEGKDLGIKLKSDKKCKCEEGEECDSEEDACGCGHKH